KKDFHLSRFTALSAAPISLPLFQDSRSSHQRIIAVKDEGLAGRGTIGNPYAIATLQDVNLIRYELRIHRRARRAKAPAAFDRSCIGNAIANQQYRFVASARKSREVPLHVHGDLECHRRYRAARYADVLC